MHSCSYLQPWSYDYCYHLNLVSITNFFNFIINTTPICCIYADYARSESKTLLKRTFYYNGRLEKTQQLTKPCFDRRCNVPRPAFVWRSRRVNRGRTPTPRRPNSKCSSTTRKFMSIPALRCYK